MRNLRKNRVLYAAGAVLFAALFLEAGIDMLLQWDNYTRPKVILTFLHLLVWAFLAWDCVNEFKVRQRKYREQRKLLK